MATLYDEEGWKEAFIAVRNQFEIDTLFPEQELAIKTFMEKDNVYKFTYELREISHLLMHAFGCRYSQW